MSTPDTFDALGPLPTGPTTTVLEASAGTGKTHTIATLVTRYLAEGTTTVERLLVVTFSRNATRELRDRVRESLVRTRDQLLVPAGDPLAAWLAEATDAEVDERRRRLDRALADFDAATVVTTHGFCQQALLALGTAAPAGRGTELVEDVSDLVDDVVTDLYLQRWSDDERPGIDVGLARALGAVAVTDPASPLDPVDAEGDPALRVEVVRTVREELARRKRLLDVFTYDDLVTSLADAVTDPRTRDAARRRLRERYDVVLADEFQDTDDLQWQILRETFVGVSTVVLIGDPKQAIYAFRGADVQSYLAARDAATQVRTLGTNWRSSAGLLRGLEAVFRGAALGDPEIVVHPVDAAVDEPVVTGGGAPVRLRVVPRGRTVKPLVVGPVRERIAADLAAQVVALLEGGARITPPGETERPLEPRDVAVLVRKHDQAELVRDALRAAGVPAISTGGADLFASDAAREWLALLEALEQPQRRSRTSRLLVGPLVDVDAPRLADDEGVRDDLRASLGRWSVVLAARGVAALWETVSRDGAVETRLLARDDGERLVTDLRHLAQELDRVASTRHLGVARLVTWLRRRVAERSGRSEHARKLESDDAAVQISTAHTAKGLEYPVVMVPFAWDHHVRDARDAVSAVHHSADRERRRDVGGPDHPDWKAHLAQDRRADLDDELRLAYVALTRPQAHLVLWWAPTRNTEHSPLHRLLMREGAPEPPAGLPVPTHEAFRERVDALAEGSDGALVVEEVPTGTRGLWQPTGEPVPALERRRLDRSLQSGWRRTSYSALTAQAHESRAAPTLAPTEEPEVATTLDETEVVPLEPPDAAVDEPVSPWDQVPGGRHLGTVVHTVLEELADPADTEALRALCDRYAHRAGADPVVLTTAIGASIATPLGPLAGGVPWSAVPAADRLPELDFELPLAGGDVRAAAPPWLGDLAGLWRAHVPDGPMAPYADALADLAPTALQGYLTGSIDAVLRVRDADGPRYLVVDHKTNRLAPVDVTLTLGHYRADGLAEAMIEAHYPLQALLYQVALHRFLRWRQPGYDPQRHLGGTLYLFLRGMAGDADAGVFSWRTPAALVVAASDLLAGAS